MRREMEKFTKEFSFGIFVVVLEKKKKYQSDKPVRESRKRLRNLLFEFSKHEKWELLFN